MGYVNARDVAHLGPLLLPHAAVLGGDPALSPAPAPPAAAPVYLLHGADDNVIPAIESSLLADSLRAKGVTVRHLATPLITHAEVDKAADTARRSGVYPGVITEGSKSISSVSVWSPRSW